MYKAKKITILNKVYEADRIIKDGNDVKLYTEGKLKATFPDLSEYTLEEGKDFDIYEEDEKILYNLGIDFRLSKIEMGL